MGTILRFAALLVQALLLRHRCGHVRFTAAAAPALALASHGRSTSASGRTD
jgi:hypothetical protein